MIHLPLELVEDARAGGQPEIDRLIEAIWPDTYRLARGILGDSHAAEDAAQDACVIVYRTISSLREASAFPSWLYRIVVREATQIKRRSARREPEIDEVATVHDESTRIDVWRALATLSPDQRTAVVLRYFEGLSSREIAGILHVPDGTVRFWLLMARRRLRPLLTDGPPLFSLATDDATDEVKAHAI
jgi:RNA polymerase sigma factor (sigma-70 family)